MERGGAALRRRGEVHQDGRGGALHTSRPSPAWVISSINPVMPASKRSEGQINSEMRASKGSAREINSEMRASEGSAREINFVMRASKGSAREINLEMPATEPLARGIDGVIGRSGRSAWKVVAWR